MTGAHRASTIGYAGRVSIRGIGVGLLGPLLLIACAKEMPPPGAHPDQVPPMIETIRPAPDTVVAGFDGQLELRFDEPVTIPSDMARRLFASPMEEYEMETGFSNMRLRPRAGWRDSVVYCFSIPGDGISDLLRNRMTEATEFCFSTGPEIVDTRIGGTVIDRVTQLPQNEARVIFWAAGDTTPYGALTDSEGRFSVRALPPGAYQAIGFLDQNRNLTPDRALEPHDSVTVVAALGAAPQLSFSVVAPDTTPPVLVHAQATDSITVQVEFDDYLINPPERDPAVVVRDSLTGVEVEVVAVRIGAVTEVVFPVPDSLADDPLADDPLAAPDSAAVLDTVAVVPARPPSADDPTVGVDPGPAEEERPILPSRFVSVRLGARLDSAIYSVQVSGVVNLRELVGGGDTTFVAAPEPPPPDSSALSLDPAALDSLGLPVDDSVAGDTLGLPPDTTGPPPDTTATRTDAFGSTGEKAPGARVSVGVGPVAAGVGSRIADGRAVRRWARRARGGGR